MKFNWSDEKREIIYHLVNSALAGALVLGGAIAGGELGWKAIGLASAAAVIVAVTKFKAYWETQEDSYSSKGKRKPEIPVKAALFSFL